MAHKQPPVPPPAPSAKLAAAAPYDVAMTCTDKIYAPLAGLGVTTVITYAYVPRSGAQLLLEQRAERAFKALSVAHPRMRAQLKLDAEGHECYVATIIPELSAAAVARSVTVRRGDWKVVAESIAEAGFARVYEAPLFSVTIVPPPVSANGGEGHVIFASHHSFQDGAGTSILAAEFFSAVALDDASAAAAAEAAAAAAPSPLPISMLEALAGTSAAPKKFELPADEATMEQVIMPVLTAMFTTSPRGPIDAELPDSSCLEMHGAVPFFKSSYHMVDGDEAKFAATRAACKIAGATINGAYTAAWAVAFSRVLESMEKVPGKVQCPLSYAFDVRPRNAVIPQGAIGCYTNVSASAPLTAGVDLDLPFWANARDVSTASQLEVVSPIGSFAAKCMDKLFTREFVLGTTKSLKGGVAAGYFMSNTGSFKGATDIAFAGSADDNTGVRLTASYCIVGANSLFFEMITWFATVGGRPTYCAMHKLKKDFGKRLFKDAVKVYEAIATIGPSESLGSVANRLLGPQYSASEDC